MDDRPGHEQMVFWSDYAKALQWLFYKRTQSRPLTEDELKGFAQRILKTEVQPPKTVMINRKFGDVSENYTYNTVRRETATEYFQ